MTSGYINSGDQRLHYLQWGSGRRLLLAMHGYSNNAAMFSALARKLEQEYTIVSLDLPHHGSSEWNSMKPWTKQELEATAQALMKMHHADRLTLAGFSIGGRICLTLAELMPQYIEQMVLIAPDGLVPNRFYQFVTGNAAGRRLFSHFLDKPEGYMNLLFWLEKRKMLDASKNKFVAQYTAATHARAFLKKVWPNLRLLVPDQQRLRRGIEQYNIPVSLFMGHYDRVIPLKNAEIFAAGSGLVKVHVLEKGHRVMDEQSLDVITQSFLKA